MPSEKSTEGTLHDVNTNGKQDGGNVPPPRALKFLSLTASSHDGDKKTTNTVAGTTTTSAGTTVLVIHVDCGWNDVNWSRHDKHRCRNDDNSGSFRVNWSRHEKMRSTVPGTMSSVVRTTSSGAGTTIAVPGATSFVAGTMSTGADTRGNNYITWGRHERHCALNIFVAETVSTREGTICTAAGTR